MTKIQRYEYQSSKYWETNVDGCTTLVRCGATGAPPVSSDTTVHPSKEAAEKLAQTKIAETLTNEYALVTGTPSNDETKRVTETSIRRDAPSSTQRAPSTTAAALDTTTPTWHPAAANNKGVATTPVTRFRGVRNLKRERTRYFWEIEQTGKTTLLSFGPIHGLGRCSSNNLHHRTEAAARAFCADKIREKLRKGYTEVFRSPRPGHPTEDIVVPCVPTT